METIRHPSKATDPKATAVDSEVFKAMANAYKGLRHSVILLLSDPQYKDYAAFTNHQYDPKASQGPSTSQGQYASIEDLHNDVHVYVGGDEGHMAELDYASFDPSFWLHHAYAVPTPHTPISLKLMTVLQEHRSHLRNVASVEP